MPPNIPEWLKRIPWSGWLIALAILFGLPTIGKLLVPLLIVGVAYYLFRQFAGQGDGQRIRTAAFATPNIPTAMRTKLPWLIAGIVVLIVLASGVVIVSAGTTGVVHLFGKVREQEISSGIHLVNPLARVERMSVRTEEFSMTKAREGGAGDALTVLTKEGLDVTLELTVLYRLQEAKASDVFKEFGPQYRDRLIRPVIRSAVRRVIAEYEAKDIYSEKREEVSVKLRELITSDLEPRGISLEEVLLRDVELPKRLTDSIQEKLSAEQEAQRYEFTLQTAKKEAERKRIEAEGQRDAQRIISSSLTPEYLHFQYIQSLKDRQGTIYVPVNPQSGLPLLRDIGR